MTDKVVSVTLATEAERPLIMGLLQFYFYDFSEMEPEGSENLEINEQGSFDLGSLDGPWSEDGFYPLVIRLGGKPAGFALINTHSHQGGTVERNMGEFFVVRKHRRAGVAQEAVRQCLALYPGRWEVAVVERNVAAKAFWPRAIAAAANVSQLTRIEGDGDHWTGPIWTFLAAPVPA